MDVLIVFGTNKGQTAKIANSMGNVLREHGYTVRVVDGCSAPADLVVEQFDAVMLGASIYDGRYQAHIVEFIKTHRAHLERVPSAFFSVSMTEADPDPHARARLQQAIQRLQDETGWHPGWVASFAGSLDYLRRRWLLRLIYRRVPQPAQPAAAPDQHAVEYTDWDAVTRFAEDFAAAALLTTQPHAAA